MSPTVRAVLDGVIEAKPTEYHGVLMRSRLEADFARYLDSLEVRWAYEPAIYGKVGSGYLPDFEILRDGRRVFIEVKPTLAEAPQAKRRMQVIWEAVPEALLLLAVAEGCRFFECLRGYSWRSFVERWPHAAMPSSRR